MANGIECLDILKEKDYDLILMDIQMPLMNGYDTTIAIRKLTDQQKHKYLLLHLQLMLLRKIVKKHWQ